MGDLRLNEISYSGNGTGVLMLNGINYTGGGSTTKKSSLIDTLFGFTPYGSTVPTGIMIFRNGGILYCVYTCNGDEFYYDTANSKIVRTGFYYVDTIPATCPARYNNFLYQNGGDIPGVSLANLTNYFIHSTYDIKDQDGNVLIMRDMNIEEFGF